MTAPTYTAAEKAFLWALAHRYANPLSSERCDTDKAARAVLAERGGPHCAHCAAGSSVDRDGYHSVPVFPDTARGFVKCEAQETVSEEAVAAARFALNKQSGTIGDALQAAGPLIARDLAAENVLLRGVNHDLCVQLSIWRSNCDAAEARLSRFTNPSGAAIERAAVSAEKAWKPNNDRYPWWGNVVLAVLAAIAGEGK